MLAGDAMARTFRCPSYTVHALVKGAASMCSSTHECSAMLYWQLSRYARQQRRISARCAVSHAICHVLTSVGRHLTGAVTRLAHHRGRCDPYTLRREKRRTRPILLTWIQVPFVMACRRRRRGIGRVGRDEGGDTRKRTDHIVLHGISLN